MCNEAGCADLKKSELRFLEGFLGAMFGGKKPDAKEAGRAARKDIEHSKRDLDHEYRRLEREEQRALQEAQRMTKAGDTAGARVMAKEIVRIRNTKQNLLKGKSQLSSVSLKTKEMESTVVMAKAMETGAKAMHQANAQMSPQQLAAVMREFEKANGTQEMTAEMLDDMFDDPEVEAEADQEVNKIFDELGLEATTGMQKAPTHKVAAASQAREDEDELVKRMAALK